MPLSSSILQRTIQTHLDHYQQDNGIDLDINDNEITNLVRAIIDEPHRYSSEVDDRIWSFIESGYFRRACEVFCLVGNFIYDEIEVKTIEFSFVDRVVTKKQPDEYEYDEQLIEDGY